MMPFSWERTAAFSNHLNLLLPIMVALGLRKARRFNIDLRKLAGTTFLEALRIWRSLMGFVLGIVNFISLFLTGL